MKEATTEILLTKGAIEQRVRELAAQISRDYDGKDLLIVGILKGAFVFMADLIRALTVPCAIDFVRMASYGARSFSSGQVLIRKDLETTVEGRDILVVEDIVDTGLTVSRLAALLSERRPASLRVCTFLDKQERRRVSFAPDYVGFSIPNAFVVGYGLDYNEQFRFLPDVRVLKENV